MRPRNIVARPRENWRDERLFSSTDLSSVLQKRKRTMEHTVSRLERNAIFKRIPEDLAAELSVSFVMVAPTLNEGEITRSIQSKRKIMTTSREF